MTTAVVPAVLAARGIDAIVPFGVDLTTRFRGVTRRRGVLLHGPAGWGEWSPFPEYAEAVAARWLVAAIEAATEEPPAALRTAISVNVTVPAVDAEEASRLVRASGCGTAKVKVADHVGALGDDLARLAAVREALGSSGQVRIDANGAWDVRTACAVLPRLAEAAGGLEYVEQPCPSLDELREVRRRTGIAVAVDEGLRLSADPLSADLADACDVLVLKVQPLGGLRRALAVARAHDLPVVVSSALETSVGLAAGVRLAAALPGTVLACGLATAMLLASDVVSAPLLPEAGVLTVAAARGAVSGVTSEGSVDETLAAGSIAPDESGALVARLDRVVAVLEAATLGTESRP